MNHQSLHQNEVERHLLLNGMSNTYSKWINHREASDVHVLEEPAVLQDANVDSFVSEDTNDCGLEVMLGELDRSEQHGNEAGQDEGNPSSDTASHFKQLIEEAKCELYPGCNNFSRFTFVIKMLHVKSYYRITNSGFSAILRILSEAFREFNTIPKSYEEAKKMLRELGLGYVSIHVCPNNCVLFRGNEYAELDNCPVCKASRWKDPERKKVPAKVLRHFPLIPRLQRLFVSKKRSDEAQWHKLKRKYNEKEMTHPADGKAWGDFDNRWPDFVQDARNLRLGLATDGFNPFSNMSSSYSMWPVFVIPYNLPPWACMDESNFIMALLIPGPHSLGKAFDVFLQPLIEELHELWSGVDTFDAMTGKEFKLRAAVLWCIHDYPALSTLSGRTTSGYFACLHCDKNPQSYAIRSKICYIGHCRFLPRGHHLRKDSDFVSLHDSSAKPGTFTIEELLEELEKVRRVRVGQKRKRSGNRVPIWGRRICLWDLPYWPTLKLRRNLDVMHIEKNVCESLLGTILDIKGKSKDTVNARLDLADLKIRKELQLQHSGDSYGMPKARYTLTKSKKTEFCNFLKEAKFPDGYASNIQRCLNADSIKWQGLKTHDCHILLQRIIPAGLRGLLDDDIYQTIAEFGKFFRELCSQKLNKDVLARMKTEIPIILCKLEKISPLLFLMSWFTLLSTCLMRPSSVDLCSSGGCTQLNDACIL